MDSLTITNSVSRLSKRIAKLVELKNEMLRMGFNTPFLGLVARTRRELEESSELEALDLAKQIEAITNLASLKKITLNRARMALAANRLALEILENGLLRDELLSVMPLDGNYIATLVNSGEHGICAYREVMDILEQRTNPKMVVDVEVEYYLDGKRRRSRLKIESGRKGAEERIREIYGDNAMIVSSRVAVVYVPLIKRRSVRVCLACSYAAIASKNVKIEPSDLLKEYFGVMSKFGLEKTIRLDAIDDEEERYSEARKMLGEKGLLEEDGSERLKAELLRELSRYRNRLADECIRKAKDMLAMDVFRLMLRSRKARSKLRIEPKDKSQFEFLSVLKEAIGLENAPAVVWDKINAEHVYDKIRVNADAFGAAFVYLTTDVSADWCTKYLGCDKDEMMRTAVSIAQFVNAREDKLSELGVTIRHGA